MKIIENPNNITEWKCEICGTQEIKPITLIPVDGEKGRVFKAHCYHIDCIELRESFPAIGKIEIYQIFEQKI